MVNLLILDACLLDANVLPEVLDVLLEGCEVYPCQGAGFLSTNLVVYLSYTCPYKMDDRGMVKSDLHPTMTDG